MSSQKWCGCRVGGERRRSCEWRWVAASERGEMARSGGGLRRRNKGLMMAMAAGRLAGDGRSWPP
jgi:hypothetical protein